MSEIRIIVKDEECARVRKSSKRVCQEVITVYLPKVTAGKPGFHQPVSLVTFDFLPATDEQIRSIGMLMNKLIPAPMDIVFAHGISLKVLTTLNLVFFAYVEGELIQRLFEKGDMLPSSEQIVSKAALVDYIDSIRTPLEVADFFQKIYREKALSLVDN